MIEPIAKRVLILGAAGKIGCAVRNGLRDRYRLMRLADIVPQAPAVSGEECVDAELTDMAALVKAMDGIDCVVHLAGVSVEPDELQWEQILPANIVGAHNVFEAARQAGVGRVVFASSHHAIGFYRRGDTIAASVAPRPDSYYGVSKVFGEAIGRLYADKFGLSVACLRIGAFRPAPTEPRHLSVWISPRDMVELIRCSIDAPAIHYCVAYGVSANARSFWDNREAASLGYAPRDNAEDFAANILAAAPAEDLAAAPFHGGWYCAMDFTGNLEAID
jgi:uronate dehydrogenase